MDFEDPGPDWLTEMDEEILDVMSSGLTLTPSVIAENIDRSRKGVSNRLNSLQAGGLVEKIDRGKYEITEKGHNIAIGFPADVKSLSSDAENIGMYRERIKNNRKYLRDFGVGEHEYLSLVREEADKIRSEEPDCDDPFDEAAKRVAQRLREEDSN